MYFEREICFDLEFVFVLLYFVFYVFYVLLYLSFLIAHTTCPLPGYCRCVCQGNLFYVALFRIRFLE